jgi:Flp pilus assembly protein TadD
MLGSEYAQLGMVTEAQAALARAANISPSFSLAHFQLGMLHLTSGEVDEARAAWSPLADIAEPHPQAYLATLRQGMLHLIDDEFDAALLLLRRGVAQNAENEPLNADMRRVIDAIEHLPGRHASEVATDSGSREPAAPPRAPPDITSRAEAEAEVAAEHLFISAYTQSGKPH